MRILVISREVPPLGGGAGDVAFHLAEQLAKVGHQIIIVTMHYGDLPFRESNGPIQIYRVHCGRKHQHSSYHLDMLRFLWRAREMARRLVKEHNCDLVHAHAIVPEGMVGARLGVPLIITAHGSDVPGYNPYRFRLTHKLIAPFWHRTLAHTAVLTTPSHFLASLMLKHRPATQIRVIPNGIKLDTFTPCKKQNSFLICSRLERRKNFDLFLQALQRVERPQTVHIVGDGPMLNRLRKLADRCRQHHVFFHGWLAKGSVEWRELYEQCRFFVFPSERENFPVNLLEAQMASMVVLATPIPGNREVLGDAAEYFESTDCIQIQRQVEEMLRRPTADLDSLGRRACERVRAKFSWEMIMQSYLDLYRECAGQPKSST